MVAPARREGFWEKLLSPRNGSRLATGSVLSFALVVMLLVVNLGLLGGNVNNSFSRIGYALSGEGHPAGAQNDGEFTPDPSLNQPLTSELSQGAAAPTQTTAASDARTDADIPAMATNLPEDMAAEPTTTALATGMGGGLLTPEVSAEVAATPPPPMDVIGSAAQATPTMVATLNRAAVATVTALAGFDEVTGYTDPGVTGVIKATVEAQGRAAAKPIPPREVSPLLDEPSGDGRGIYYGLMVLFLALGILLGVGALVARRRSSH
jgi:hypothetical protein